MSEVSESFTAEDFETVKNNIANDLDKKFNMKGAGLKIFDVIGKVAGPVDEVLLGTLNKGIPTLFKNTALAGVAARMSPMLGKALVYLTLANLGVGAIRGSMTFAKEYGGDTSKAIDAILSGEIPEKTFSEAMKESLSEGFAEFGDQMQYDPFYMLVDKTVLQPLTGGKDQGYIMEKGMEYGSKGIAGIKNLFGSK